MAKAEEIKDLKRKAREIYLRYIEDLEALKKEANGLISKADAERIEDIKKRIATL